MAWLVHADATENDGINLGTRHLLLSAVEICRHDRALRLYCPTSRNRNFGYSIRCRKRTFKW
jgi:hypothetical protein